MDRENRSSEYDLPVKLSLGHLNLSMTIKHRWRSNGE